MGYRRHQTTYSESGFLSFKKCFEHKLEGTDMDDGFIPTSYTGSMPFFLCMNFFNDAIAIGVW